VIELLLTNVIYVAYRLIVSGPIVKILNNYLPYYAAVFVMAQFSFAYDTFVFGHYFNATDIPSIMDYIYSDIMYTMRVIAAWWLIRQIWKVVKNYWLAVFIGAEITFIFDYFIFANLYS
jgi:hypothetical protein